MAESISVTSAVVKSSCKTDTCGRRPEVKMRTESFPQVNADRSGPCGPEAEPPNDANPVNKGTEEVYNSKSHHCVLNCCCQAGKRGLVRWAETALTVQAIISTLKNLLSDSALGSTRPENYTPKCKQHII